MAGFDGFSDQGSSSRLFLCGSHGNFLGAISRILRPNLPFEWATLLSNSYNSNPGGQTSPVADGPSGCSFTSYQKPYHSEPAAWFLLTVLNGLVIQ